MVHSQHVSPLERLTSERFVLYLLALLLYLDIASVLTLRSSLLSPDGVQIESLIAYAPAILLSYVFLAGFILPILHSILVDIAVLLAKRSEGKPSKDSVNQEELVRIALRHNNLVAYELARHWTQDAEIKRSIHFAAFSVLCFGVIEAALAIIGYTPLLRDAVTRSSAISRPLSIAILVSEIVFFLFVFVEVCSIKDWTTTRLRVGKALEAYEEAESEDKEV